MKRLVLWRGHDGVGGSYEDRCWVQEERHLEFWLTGFSDAECIKTGGGQHAIQ